MITHHERILAFLRGKPHDRVPLAQYSGILAADEEAWQVLGRENLGLIRWSWAHRFDYGPCTQEQQDYEADGLKAARITWHTPEGDLVEERRMEPVYGSSQASKHYVTEPDDYRKLLSLLRNTRVGPNFEHFLADVKQIGNDGVCMCSVARTPYQQLWVQWVSLEDLCLHLVDIPGVMEEVIAELTRILRDIFRVVCQAVREVEVPYVNFGDNITAPVIGEKYFRRYCVPFYNELAGLLEEQGSDVPVAVHMDGHLKALWPAIAESKVRVLDSFSPVPDNDTRVDEALALRGDMKLGMNFPSSVHLRKPDEIYDVARDILRQGGRSGRLMIQISENVPRNVWRQSMPPIVRAIHDFGSL